MSEPGTLFSSNILSIRVSFLGTLLPPHEGKPHYNRKRQNIQVGKSQVFMWGETATRFSLERKVGKRPPGGCVGGSRPQSRRLCRRTIQCAHVIFLPHVAARRSATYHISRQTGRRGGLIVGQSVDMFPKAVTL